MSGTKSGGKLAAETNKLLHGDDFYARIGSKGGQNGTTGGFAARIPCHCSVIEGEHELQRCAGTKGGYKSRRTKKSTPTDLEFEASL